MNDLERLIHSVFLTGTTLYRAYERGTPKTMGEIEALVFKEVRQTNTAQADHYYKPYLDDFFSKHDSLAATLLASFKQLTEMLHFRNDVLYVHFGQFETWQLLLTAVPPLPLLAFAYHHHYSQRGQEARAMLEQHRPFRHSLLPIPFHPLLHAMFRDQPPPDLHVHLNGTTEADLVWQYALTWPWATYRDFAQVRRKTMVKEQYLALHEAYQERDLFDNLLAARDLRTTLPLTEPPEKTWCGRFMGPVDWQHPYKTADLEDHECELLLWVDCFARLGHEPQLATRLHHYLLRYGFFYKFVVQQEDQKGFDQFQKITLNEMRSLSERSYRRRFDQMGAGDRISYLDGRFAPNNNLSKLKELLARIILDYEKFQGWQDGFYCDVKPRKKRHKMELRLVAHFIKKAEKDDDSAKLSRPCRHYDLRRSLALQARNLIYLHQKVPKIRHYVTGADAAANELHAPPEVFAPVFRSLRDAGWVGFTYHVGEDYRHLVAGIRAIYEAVVYLGLRDGCRIGHGTAIGIDPEQWLDQCPKQLKVPCGDWLDNLVFTHALYVEAELPSPPRLRDEIERYWHKIYDECMPGLATLVDAWRLRGFDPLLFDQPATFALNPISQLQFDKQEKARQQNPNAFDLFQRYHQTAIRRKSQEWVEVDAHFFTAEQLTFLQDRTIELLNARVVAIESMPTSNVRIAPYTRYRDHHLFRWRGLTKPGAAPRPDGPRPTVVLASDDPGIFANHVQAEYAHVLETLVNDYKLSHDDAMAHLERINKSGRDYLFGVDAQPTPDEIEPLPKDPCSATPDCGGGRTSISRLCP